MHSGGTTPSGSCLLTVSGKVFCGGGDIAEFGACSATACPRTFSRVDPRSSWRDGRLRSHGRLPLVVAIAGSAGGAGLSLASVAGSGDRHVTGQVHVGLHEGRSDARWERLVLPCPGHRTAQGHGFLVLTNRVLTAAEAEAWGLVNRVVDDDEVDKAAEDLVASLAAGPTGAFGAAKWLWARAPR